MGRKAEEPLEGKLLRLYEGDFARLQAILAPRRVSASVFIRKLLRRYINQIEARVNIEAKPVEIDNDALIREAGLDTNTTAHEQREFAAGEGEG